MSRHLSLSYALYDWLRPLVLLAATLPLTAAAQSFYSLEGAFDDAGNELHVRFQHHNDLGPFDPFGVRTYHYSGGTNEAGDSISGQNFDPRLDMFDANDQFVVGNDDIDLVSNLYDAAIARPDLPPPVSFAAGSYRATMGVVGGSLPTSPSPWAVDFTGPTGNMSLRQIDSDGSLKSLKFGSHDVAGSAIVDVSGPDQTPLDFTESVHVGEFGAAGLTVRSTQLSAADFFSGWNGLGITGIYQGGIVRASSDVGVAWLSGSGTSLIRVADPGSVLEAGSSLYVGDEAEGGLDVQSGGRVAVGGSGYLGRFNANAAGRLTVEGTGSRVDVASNLFAGGDESRRGGTATVTVGSGGSLNAGSTGTDGLFKLYSGSRLDVNSGGTVDVDALSIESGVALNTQPGSTVRVNNLNGFGSTQTFNGSLEFGTKNGVHIGFHQIGAGTALSVGEDLVVGEQIQSWLTISDGGWVDTGGSAFVARNQDLAMQSYVKLDGANQGNAATGWHVSKSLYVAGDDGSTGSGVAPGLVEVANGAWLVVDDRLQVWDEGTVAVDATSYVTVGTQGFGLTGKLNVIGGGVLSGTGNVEADVVNLGVISPGASPGTLHIGGDFEQLVDGMLQIDIGGVSAGLEYDQLEIRGDAQFDGWLRADFVDLSGNGPFAPSGGETFDVATVQGTYSGGFSQYDLPALPLGMEWAVNYLPDVIQLQVATVLSFEADFNKDGRVDGDDFLIWQASFNQILGAATHNDGDANGDGLVDGEDFLIWQQQFGSGSGGGGTTIPEPATTTLLCLVACVAAGFRRCQIG